MNNYIDERMIGYRRSQKTANRADFAKMGRPLTQKKNQEGIVLRSLKLIAGVFLLFVSTFSGEMVEQSDISLATLAKTCMKYAGIILALWGVLVLLSNVVNAISLLPVWSLIVIFAAAVLGVSSFVLK